MVIESLCYKRFFHIKLFAAIPSSQVGVLASLLQASFLLMCILGSNALIWQSQIEFHVPGFRYGI